MSELYTYIRRVIYLFLLVSMFDFFKTEW